MKLEDLYSILNNVLPNGVFYGINVYDDSSNADMPYIVYHERSKRPIGYHDDKPILYNSIIQITLVTKSKDLMLEKMLESSLLNNNIAYDLISEYINSDKSVNRVYDINMEENNNGE